MKFKDILNEYYDPAKDEVMQRDADDVRRPRLCLQGLNKIRKRREIKRYEESKYKKFLPLIYGQPDQE